MIDRMIVSNNYGEKSGDRIFIKIIVQYIKIFKQEGLWMLKKSYLLLILFVLSFLLLFSNLSIAGILFQEQATPTDDKVDELISFFDLDLDK